MFELFAMHILSGRFGGGASKCINLQLVAIAESRVQLLCYITQDNDRE